MTTENVGEEVHEWRDDEEMGYGSGGEAPLRREEANHVMVGKDVDELAGSGREKVQLREGGTRDETVERSVHK